MQEALALVRRDLGPAAAVLQTRPVRGGGLLKWIGGTRQIEVVASRGVVVPSRLPAKARGFQSGERPEADAPPATRAAQRLAAQAANGIDLSRQISQLQSTVDQLCRQTAQPWRSELPPELFHLFTDLLEADISDDVARELVERVRRAANDSDLVNPAALRGLLEREIASQIAIADPICAATDKCRLVVLVGPTGVGKTTTIAKLAANFRLRDKCRVGLITVDTYRIAAVEQLRTYADIIDLPMEIVATPREMHQAVARMAGLDLVLMDTAGRSPRDEVQIQELRAMLAEAAPDEVHLVLSSVASAGTLSATARQFSTVGITSIILTKLDEAVSLGNLLPLVQDSRLPISYLTHGQNVPDDIAPASAVQLTRALLGDAPVCA